jgi:hypothetical protein
MIIFLKNNINIINIAKKIIKSTNNPIKYININI